jgi:hypothetical protein
MEDFMKTRIILFFSFCFLFSASEIYATDLAPTSISRPGNVEYVGQGFNIAFIVANLNVLTAPANRWYVKVEIRNASNQVIWTTDPNNNVPGVNISPSTSVTMQTSQQFIPTGEGTYTVIVTVVHQDEINPGNDIISKSFSVMNGAPGQITNISPANNATNVRPRDTEFSWTNGSVPFTQTRIYIQPNSSNINWNATPTYTTTCPSCNYYIHTEDLPGNTQTAWGVEQTNSSGTTQNGPFVFITSYLGPPPIANIFPPDGAVDVPVTKSLSWENGDGQIDQTRVFVWPSQAEANWNASPVFTTTNTIGYYTPSENWPFNTEIVWGIQQSNSIGTTNNGPYSFVTQPAAGAPSLITDVNPPDDAINVPYEATEFSWTNGSNPIELTEVFINTSSSEFDWNAEPAITNTGPDFHGFTYDTSLPPGTNVTWGVEQTNGNGHTRNGPYSFRTQDALPDEISNITPADGAVNVSLSQPLSWTNGGVQIDETAVHVWPSQDDVNWNSNVAVTNTLSTFNSYLPTDGWQPLTQVWWGITQTNNGGSTHNGPYHFTTGALTTDLIISRIVSPRSMENPSTDIPIQIEVENLGPNIATGWSVPFSISNSANQIVVLATLPGTSLAPGNKTILNYSTQWRPETPGKYRLNASVQFNNDSNKNNNNKSLSIEILEQFSGIPITSGMGVDFFQVDLTFESDQLYNSPYGLVSVNYDQLKNKTGKTFGYLNCFSQELGWFVQNLIFDASLELFSAWNGLSTFFDLSNLQSPSQPNVTQFEANVFLSDQPIVVDYKSINFNQFTLEDRPYNAQGVLMPKGTIAAPMKFDKIPFVEGGKDDLVWQHNHVSIEQDKDQCAPTAVANSLQWLENKKEITVAQEHKSGIRDNTLVGELDKAMERQPHEGVSIENFHKGKLKFISDNNLSNKLKIKHKNRVGTNYLTKDTLKVGTAKSIPNNDSTLSLIDWILQELKDGENVELVMLWNGGGGHVVDLIGGGYVKGIPWLAWVHDANQGYDNNGTPGDKTDDKVKRNGGISPDSNGVGHCYIIDNKIYVPFANGDTSKGKIAFAISESQDTTTTNVEPINNELPSGYKLYQNFPNPFNPSTTIRIDVPKLCRVRVLLFDALGREILKVADRDFSAGTHIFTLNMENYASGVYYYIMETENFRDSKKFILLK